MPSVLPIFNRASSWASLGARLIWIFNDRTQASKETNYAGIGHYTISDNSYSFGFDEWQVLTQTAAGINVSRKLPFEGMRSFTPVKEPDGMRLRNAETQTKYLCSEDTLTYSLGQSDYRKYRRIKSD
jgi:hypothetical protein